MASVVLTTAQYFGGYNHFGGFGFNSLTDNFGNNQFGSGGFGGLGGGIAGGQPSVRDPRQNRGLLKKIYLFIKSMTKWNHNKSNHIAQP